VKISKKTLAAAQKAADDQGVSLDTWAEKVLAAAAAAQRSPDYLKLLRDMSGKIDQIANRQGLAERANEQLTVAIQEAGKSYAQMRRTTGHFLGEIVTKTSSALEEVRGKTQELITGQPSDEPAQAAETGAARTTAPPQTKRSQSKRKQATKKPSAKPRAAGAKSKPTAPRKAPGRRK